MVTNTGDQKISAVPGRVGIYDLCQKVPVDSQLYSIIVNYVLVKSKLQHRPWAFDIFAVPGAGEFEPQP